MNETIKKLLRVHAWEMPPVLPAHLVQTTPPAPAHDLQHEYDKYRRAAVMYCYGASERQIETMLKEFDEMNTTPAPTQQPPQCPAPCARGLEPAERVALIQQELAEAEAALADKTARDALVDRIDADCKLAGATTELLHEVMRLRVHGLEPRQRTQLAKYRKELAPLAESYGVRIVLVGDKTAATLVLA